MKEQLITFETAKLAKEKDFPNINIGINNMYTEEGHFYNSVGPTFDEMDSYQAPTQSLLQKWLREKHDIHININTYYFEDLQKYGYEVEDIIYPEGWVVVNNPKVSYEEALEFGLQEALKLIKL